MTPKGSDLEATDLLEVSTIESGSYVTRSITGQEIIDAAVGNVDWGDIGGTLSDQTDLNTALSGKVPTTRTLTINGTTQDLSADRTFTISTGITIGTTAITSGTVGRVLFEGTGNVVSQSANLFWDATNNRLGVGTSSTSGRLSVLGTSTTVPNNATWISAGNPIASLFGEGIGGNMDLFIGGASSVSSARPVLTGRKSAGTLASPTALSNGDNIFSFLSGGYSGTSFVNTGSINMIVDGVVSSGTVPQAITFETGTSSRAERLRIGSNGNVLINTTTDAGFKLDVNGTARVQDNVTVQKNQNLLTSIDLTNTTSGANSYTQFSAISDVNSGANSFGKYSTLKTAYKIIQPRDSYYYNGSIAGDFAILNDCSSGKIKFAAGGASTAHMTLFSTGNFAINTTTDAGFRLDVNGTARVVGNTLLDSGIIATSTATTRLQGSLNYFTHNRIASSGAFGFQISSYGTLASFFRWSDATYDTEIGGAGSPLIGGLKLFTAGTEKMQITSGGLVLIGTSTAIASSKLTIESTTQGFLPPRMTTTQKNAIATPAAGLMVYDTTLNLISYYNGTSWI
jgi:hypothetical protein